MGCLTRCLGLHSRSVCYQLQVSAFSSAAGQAVPKEVAAGGTLVAWRSS